eukprot:Protomagalhaensia_wolfi_Nauph_80__119@NODE_1067_length_1760_cov_112_079605_g810_i0_p2_GENE_NODE_1067_length_1760_cov_112_079605_g810_i0NODE_1067_length_1760_cov_112_079605_g810_i0_p2_ORF_typecomplete_len128_score24_46ABM/PF03992_16/1_3e15Cupin_7/PF12973_7/1_7e02Cupin_7/PF12973_7/0_88DUF4188/PF13826_6/0_07_NODE_1067_length_1760_cov_112_079605_g810_i0217600
MCACVSKPTKTHTYPAGSHIFVNHTSTQSREKKMGVELVVVVKFKEDDLKALTPALEHLARESQKEDGCHRYTLHAAEGEPNTRIILEEWESDEHLTAHQKTKHFQDWGQQSNGKTETALYRISKLV